VLDPELDESQYLGDIPQEVLAKLWPGFVPQNYHVYINLVRLRRHMQNKPDWMDRVSALNQQTDRLIACLRQPYVFARYEVANPDDAGVNAYGEVPGLIAEPTTYIALGIRLLPTKLGDGKPNDVRTLIPPMSAKKLHNRLNRVTHCWPDGRLQVVKRSR
jgi:hypothetical protein